MLIFNNCKAFTQYIDTGAHGGAGMMHQEGLTGLSGPMAVEFNPQLARLFNDRGDIDKILLKI